MVNSRNAMHLRFDVHTGLPVAAEHPRLHSCDASVGSNSDIRRALAHLGCDGELLTDNWISNHKRWIVWKLASYERKFARYLGGRHLSYESVVKQLVKRFEKEIREGHRPAIRKILNRDVAASRMMILAVSQILPPTVSSSSGASKSESKPMTSHLKVELTDGWYSVQAVLDSKLSEFVLNGFIQVGTKLLSSNALLIGAEEGVDPLDDDYAPSDPRCKVGLRMTANGTRLANWNAKLGFVKSTTSVASQGLLLVRKVSDIIAGGGYIPMLRLFVLRRYPRVYYEKGHVGDLDKDERRSRSRFLSEAEEDVRRMEFDKRRTKAYDALTETLQKDIEKVRPHPSPTCKL
jgi:breast cancer 2 susceptibility protein